MKHNYSFRRTLSVLVLLMASALTWAQDLVFSFNVDGIYYTILNEGNVKVTYGKIETPTPGYSGNIIIPSSVTYYDKTYNVTCIGDHAFYECSSLTSIVIPESVTVIGGYAFYFCSSLTSINIPESVTYIGDYAFYECSSLTSINIPDSVTYIGDYAFSYCSSLTSVVIPDGVKNIGCETFYSCSSLTSILIPESVTNIGNHAFFDCSSLKSIDIPSSVTSIESYAFCKCTSLTSINIPDGVTSIGDGAFYSCISLTSVVIGNGVTNLEGSPFNYCYSLTSIAVSEDNPVYDSREGCNAIIETASNTLILGCMNTIIPNSVTSIIHFAFEYCSSLTFIDIPSSVTSIGGYAFSYCSSLTTVICRAENIPEIVGRFEHFPISEATLYVPASALEEYKAADGWKNFGTILPLKDDEDGIDSPEAPLYKEANTPYYTLDGKPTANPIRKGIYVKDGRKVMIR